MARSLHERATTRRRRQTYILHHTCEPERYTMLWMSTVLHTYAIHTPSWLWNRTGCGPLFLLLHGKESLGARTLTFDRAIVIFVPVPSLQGFHRVQQRLTRELEKKFSDRHVLILASRRILPRPKRSNRSRTSLTQKRPRSRTLTAVHDAILTDLVYPVEIVGKRLRTKEDGSKILKVVLDEKEKGGVDHRLDTYSEVYKKLTGRGVNFEFPQGGAVEY
ncbi:ribosomal protein S7e [Stipitochalara longipes BDJ]|nr:ribosomal protein S7e [Stipitochalara longipes BDJ]